jgi:hypothetical protein
MPRQTPDLVALILTLVVAIVVVATVLAMIYILLTNPTQDISRAADAIGRIVSVIIAAVVGYLAGRRVNGKNGH